VTLLIKRCLVGDVSRDDTVRDICVAQPPTMVDFLTLLITEFVAFLVIEFVTFR